MADDLIQRLRTCPVEERRAIAMELAQTGTDEAVTELVKIVEGGNYTPPRYNKKHWYSLDRTLLEEENFQYNSDEQLMAVEALGETRSRKAYNYLNWLIAKTKSSRRRYGMKCRGGFVAMRQFVRFPRAKGGLYKMLQYDADVARGDYLSTLQPVQGELEAARESNIAYQAVLKAIQKLEKNLQNAPSD